MPSASVPAPIVTAPPPPPPAPPPAAQPAPQHQRKPAYGGAAAPSKGPSSIELAPGTLFANKYRIEKQLGKGGMGAVYLATQEMLNRRIAIKLLHLSSDEVTAARFQREARVIAQCQHPNIVNLIDFGEDDGRLFLVMEFIDGLSLTELLKREAPFPAKRVCDIGMQIAEALATAHDINVIHRDLKPDNIMVASTAGRRDYVKILDFGVAKIKRDPSEGMVNTVETKAGLIVGSLRYISPEQVESGEITTRTDMYSFGCVLFEMLAGRRVFDYPSPADCAIAHLTEPPKPPVVQGQVLEGPLVDFIMQCLEKKSERRPTNGRVAAQVLNSCRDNPLKSPPPPSEMQTLAMVEGGFDALQASRTLPPAAPLPPLRQSDIPHSAQSQRPASASLPAAPAPARSSPPTGPDLQMRPARPPGAEGFSIVGGGDMVHTATHLDGVRLQPRTGVQATRKKSLAWVWLVLALVLGGAAVTLVALKPWAESTAGGGTATPPTREASADAGSTATGAVATGAAADTESGTAPSDDAAIAADAATAVDDAAPGDDTGPDAAVTAALQGVEIVSSPESAQVTMLGKQVGTTPYTVTWEGDAPPPIVRISRKGYVDVDLQLVNSDRGTQRRVELRPLEYR